MYSNLHSHLLSTLKTCTTTHHLKQTHSLLLIAGVTAADFTSHLLHLTSLLPPPDPTYASLLFHLTSAPHRSTWHHMLCSHHETAISHYVHLRRHGHKPDDYTYPLILKAFASNHHKPNQLHAEIFKFGFDSDLFVLNALLSAYSKSKNLGAARKVFDGMPRRDVVSWTAMVNGYVSMGREIDGIGVFTEMRVDGVQVDGVVIVSVLNSCGIIGNVWLGRCVHGFYVECGRVVSDVYVGTALVDMYGKCDFADDARRMFDTMPETNVVTWSALIASYVHCARYTDAISVFRDMLAGECDPNQVTLSSVLTACAQLGVLGQGRWIHRYMERNQMRLNSVTGTSLIDMYAKCGCIADALHVFHGLAQKSVHSWTAMINGLALHGLAEESVNVFTQMTSEGVRPNEVTFVGVLSACSHGGLLDEGRRYFGSMFEEYGIEPKLAHYGCMIDLLGRAGCLEEALHLIESMPMEPSTGAWVTLLGACMIHKDFALGKIVGKHLAAMQPHHGGRYAILANMYSHSQKWEEVANIRMMMKEKGVEKTPGCSWLEVNSVLHEFVAFNEGHPQSKIIYETLHGVNKLMKLEGHLRNSLLLSEMEVRSVK